MKHKLYKCTDLIEHNGVFFDLGLQMKKLVITGPPCAGKSTLVHKIGGWPQEGYLDLSQDGWWRTSGLAYRPREAHLCFPFPGFEKDMTVFDPVWLNAHPSPEPDYSRILIPPAKRGFFSINWRDKLCFDFIIPLPETTLEFTLSRAREGTHHVDRGATLERVTLQAEIYHQAAHFFHSKGLQVYVRECIEGPPHTFGEKQS